MQTRFTVRHRGVLTGAGVITATVLTLSGCGSDSSSSSGDTSSSSSGSASSTSPSTTSSSGSSSSAAGGSGSSSSAAGKSGSYTMAQVKSHNTASSCWAVIDKNVYNLTTWIAKHPGGPDKIKPLCGTDATKKFRSQHDSQQEPNSRLATFKIGKLAG